jgi:hypothetical protein
MSFDDKATQTVINLENLLDFKPDRKASIICPYTIGAEIEVKFKYFFPELFKEFFAGTNYFEMEYDRRVEITKIVDIVEKPTRNLLEATIEAGIPKGNDKYWEFAFNPVNNLTLLFYQIDILKKAKLIPSGEHSFHISVGGLTDTPTVYYVLMALELLFIKKDRIQQGFNEDRTASMFWAKKGTGGILKKNKYDLINETVGFEFRTFVLYDDTDVYKIFQTLNYFLSFISEGRVCPELKELKAYMLNIGLPDINWDKPHKNPDIWERYIDNFDVMSLFMKELMINIEEYAEM